MNNIDVPTQIVNVAEMKRKKKNPTKDVIKEPIKRFIIYGAAVSVLFALLGFVNTAFIYLSPLGVIIGVISWGIKNLFNKLNLKDNLQR